MDKNQLITPETTQSDGHLLDRKGRDLDAPAEVDILDALGRDVHNAAHDPTLLDAYGNAISDERHTSLYDKQGSGSSGPKQDNPQLKTF